MTQKAALCLSFVALAVTAYLCLSPLDENQSILSTKASVVSSEPEQELVPADDVPLDKKPSEYLVDIEKVKRLLDDDPFLYPTDQMFRDFDIEAVR